MNFTKNLWHLPVVLMLAVYLPGGLFGFYVFNDKYSKEFLLLLMVFTLIYYGAYKFIVSILKKKNFIFYFSKIGDSINWKMLAWLCVFVYLIVLLIAVLTVAETPIVAALRGGDWLDIAIARGDLFVNRQGWEVSLRYLSVILGRTIMPLLVTYLFWTENKFKYWALLLLLCCYGISLEKGASLFAFLPIILISLARREIIRFVTYLCMCATCIAIWTHLSMGGLHRQEVYTDSEVQASMHKKSNLNKIGYGIGRHGDPQRHFFFNFLNSMGVEFDNHTDPNDARGKLMIMTNRILWIPYVTAYDWLKFSDEILNSRLTLGRSIGLYTWLIGEPKLEIEKMVYEYEFGVPEGGAGASNTVFLVDAKVAFGWFGVFIYCFIFVFCSSVIFSSRNTFIKYASVTSFFTAAVSPLTATLFSGGLFFLMLICMLCRPNQIELINFES